MVTKEEIEKIFEKFLQSRIDYLKSVTENYKHAINRCDVADISGHSWIISQSTRFLKNNADKLTTVQDREFDDLQNQYIAQFDRLRKGYCECKPKI